MTGAIRIDAGSFRDAAHHLAAVATKAGAGTRTLVAAGAPAVTGDREVDGHLADYERALVHHHSVLADQTAKIARLLSKIAEGVETVDGGSAERLEQVVTKKPQRS